MGREWKKWDFLSELGFMGLKDRQDYLRRGFMGWVDKQDKLRETGM